MESRAGSKIKLSEAEWRERLGPEAYEVLRQGATERPFSGALYHNKAQGLYACGACSAPLFKSTAKYDSGSGWPSFFEPVVEGAIAYHEDKSHGMTRVEITCSSCGSHLGHVFDDGPRPTGKRYCVNSLSLKFQDAGKP